MNTPQVVTLLPVAVAIGVLVFIKTWIRSRPNPLATRYRLLVVGMWMLCADAVAMALQLLGGASDRRFIVGLLCLILAVAGFEWERRRLRRQLNERSNIA